MQLLMYFSTFQQATTTEINGDVFRAVIKDESEKGELKVDNEVVKEFFCRVA